MENTIADAAITMLFLCPFIVLLAVGGFLADCVLPRCPRLIRFLERTFDIDLGDDDYE